MNKRIHDGLHRIRRLFSRKKDTSGYRSFDPQFRTAYGKSDGKRPKKKKSASFFSRIFHRKKIIRDEGYRRSEPKKIPVVKIAAGIVLFAGVVLAYRIGQGWQGWRRVVPAIPLFQLHEVTFTGCSKTKEDALRSRAGLVLYRTNLLQIDLREVERKIADEPWVSSVKVARDWPSSLVIRITEHVPLALVNGAEGKDGSGLSYMDRDGAIFIKAETGMDIDYPVVTGLERVKGDDLRREVVADITGFIKQTQKNDPNLPTQAISEMHVNANGEIVVFLVEYPFPIFFGRGKMETKYNRLVKVLEVLYKKDKGEMQISRVEYIRMDYLEDKVLVAQSGSD